MKIINETNLSYSTIGLLIDNVMEKNKGNTMYYGKTEHCIAMIGNIKVNIQIRYLKTFVEWRFWKD